MKQALTNFLKKFEVNGYSPLSIFNIMLALATIVGIIFTKDNLARYGGFSELLNFDNPQNDGISIAINALLLGASVLCPVILLIRNLKIKSIPKYILYTVLQFVLGVIVGVIYLLILIIGSFFGGSNSSSKTKTYTNEEDQYAKANGYFDAQSANEKGFDTSQANNAGFDYTQKRD